MTEDLVTRIRNVFEDTPQIMTWFDEETYVGAETRAHISGMWETLKEAANHIEHLERELGEERHSREVAAAKGWEFSDRIKALEQVRDHAYRERNHLAAFLSHLYPAGTKATNIPGWDKELQGCVYVDLPTGQVSWHYHKREAHLFAHLPVYEKEWDGHCSEEKYERLARSALEKTDD